MPPLGKVWLCEMGIYQIIKCVIESPDVLTNWFTNKDHVVQAFQYLHKHHDRPDVCEILKLLCPETSGRPYGIVCTSPEFYPVIIKKIADHVPMNVYLGTNDMQLNRQARELGGLPPGDIKQALEGENSPTLEDIMQTQNMM